MPTRNGVKDGGGGGGDITSVVAGNGLSGGGTDGDVTVSLTATATAPADVTKAAAAAGTATEAARADHKHDITTAAPSTIGTANSEGSSSSLARADHVHNVGTVAAANVKHRSYPSFRVNNKTANSTQAGLWNADLEFPPVRAGRINAWSYFGNLVTAGSALSAEVSVDGGATWTQIASIPAGTLRTSGTPLNTFTYAAASAGGGIQARFVSDASWSSTTTDPQIVLECEDT